MPSTKKWSTLAERVEARPGAAARIAGHRKRQLAELEEYTLAELRRSVGVTQTELAELIGRTQSAISQMESGTYAITVDTLRSIVTQLGGELTITATLPGNKTTTINL